MSLVIGSGLRLGSGSAGGTIKKLADLQTYLAADHPWQVVKVTDRAEAPNAFTWVYSDGAAWKSVYKRDTVSTDPDSLSPILVGSLWNPLFMNVDTDHQDLYGYVTLTAHQMGDEPATHLIVNFMNAYLKPDSAGPLTNTGNAQPLQKLALHIPGAPKPAYVFWNGSRSYVIADGAADVNADEVPASAFGLDEIPGASIVTAKLLILYDGPAGVPYSNRNPAEGQGTAMYRFKPGDGTNGTTAMSDVDVPGAFTWTGTEPVSRSGGYYPFILARHKSKKATALMAIGTSITSNFNDPANVFAGPAWFQRGIKMFKVRPGAFNFAIAGSTTQAGKGEPRIQAYYKYCTGAVLEHPTNDFLNPSALTAAMGKARVDGRRDELVEGGIPADKIALVLPIAYTSGDYTTEAGQTPHAGWGAGEVVQQYKALAMADPSYGLKLDRWSLLGEDGLVFKPGYTVDGLHLERASSIIEATAVAPPMEAFFKVA
ncbi:hypothetical protein ABQX22_13780 [Xanthomonas sp. WHRI 1810A]|uniref:hypothetical protein n=1 Tax=Xanthomonas sp. WHRI 1810A TaxID=3161565 RepID=UPI0032E8EDEB